MTRFTINPPNGPMVDAKGHPIPDWYRFFSRVQGVLGEDVVSQITSAPVLTYAASTAFSDDKILTQGTGLSITSGASTLTVGLDTANSRNVDHTAVTLTAGAGLTGGGDISASLTFNVGAGTGISVDADSVGLDTASTRNTDHASVTLTAGDGLTGGGDISASRTFNVGAGTGITVNADDIEVDPAVVALLSGATFTGEVILPDAGPSDVYSAGYRGEPVNEIAADYTLVLSDAGKTIYHDNATPHTVTIPANASVAYPRGTRVRFVNRSGSGAVTIAITSDTLRFAGSASTGSRTLAADGMAEAVKTDTTEWYIADLGGLT